jgi:antitoxin MazE
MKKQQFRMEVSVMETHIVRIGNSQEVRIPKRLLEKTGLQGEVEIIAGEGFLVIRPLKRPRENWAAAFTEPSVAIETAYNCKGKLVFSMKSYMQYACLFSCCNSASTFSRNSLALAGAKFGSRPYLV